MCCVCAWMCVCVYIYLCACVRACALRCVSECVCVCKCDYSKTVGPKKVHTSSMMGMACIWTGVGVSKPALLRFTSRRAWIPYRSRSCSNCVTGSGMSVPSTWILWLFLRLLICGERRQTPKNSVRLRISVCNLPCSLDLFLLLNLKIYFLASCQPPPSSHIVITINTVTDLSCSFSN